MPRAYGYAPSDEDLWKNQQDKDASRQKMFDSMDLVSFNLLRVQTWLFWSHLSCIIILISQYRLGLLWSDLMYSFLALESHRCDHFRRVAKVLQ